MVLGSAGQYQAVPGSGVGGVHLTVLEYRVNKDFIFLPLVPSTGL